MNTAVNTFNPEAFLNTTMEESNSTEFVLVPEGEYIAVSGPISADSFRSFDIKQGERAGQKGYGLDIQWDINDDTGALRELLGRTPRVKQGLMLDLTNGTLEMGKGRNVGLGRLREALNMNMTGRPFAFSMLGGQVAKIKVKHRIDKNSGQTFAEVSEVTRVS